MTRLNEISINTNNHITPKRKISIYTNSKYQEAIEIINRLYLQSLRRPASLIISIIQPLLWLLLFGALFENAPIYLFEHYNIQYREFLHPGIVIFTGFNSAINAGLPIIFDREFGFLNRILVSPINHKNSIIYSSILHTWLIATIQIIIIIVISLYSTNNINDINITITDTLFKLTINTIIVTNISIISICNALILPGHIEFIALTTLLLNLPTLFASTALAPLSFMPRWLQIICCFNPLTYAIEIIRNQTLNKSNAINIEIINIGWLKINSQQGMILLILFTSLSLIIAKKIIKYKYD